MLNDDFRKFLGVQSLVSTQKCLDYVTKNNLCLVHSRVKNHDIFFFVNADSGYGVVVPKYIVKDTERFLKTISQDYKFFANSIYHIVVYTDNGERDIMSQSYVGIYNTYVVKRQYVPIKVIGTLNNIDEIAVCLCKDNKLY